MFQEQQEIGNLVGTTLFNELSLKRQCFVVSDQPKTTDLELAHVHFVKGSDPRVQLH